MRLDIYYGVRLVCAIESEEEGEEDTHTHTHSLSVVRELE